MVQQIKGSQAYWGLYLVCNHGLLQFQGLLPASILFPSLQNVVQLPIKQQLMKSILLALLALCAFSCVNPSMDQGRLLSSAGNAAMMQPINQGNLLSSAGNAAMMHPGHACLCCSPKPTPFQNHNFNPTPTPFQNKNFNPTPIPHPFQIIRGYGGCQIGKIWAGDRCKSCSQIPNMHFKFSSCECNSGYVWRGYRCQRDCSKVPNSFGQQEFSDRCRCSPGYSWKDDTCKQNRIQCSNILNTDGQTSDWSCRCRPGFKWADGSSSCEPIADWVDCSLVSNSIGRASDSTCMCRSDYTWENKACRPKRSWVDCSSVANSNGRQLSFASCECNSGYVWKGRLCILSALPLNCSKIANSNGIKSSSSSCECLSGYVWKDKACVPFCSTKSNNNGIFIQSSQSCECNEGFRWSNGNCIKLQQPHLSRPWQSYCYKRTDRPPGVVCSTGPRRSLL